MLEDIEITAKRETTKTALDIREVRESSAPDIGEALQSVPGLNKLRKGGIASDIILRGLKNDDINVIVDGQRIYGACPNRMDPPAFHIDFQEVDKIEITRGPYDVRNAGSLGGLIEIVSKSPKEGLHTEGSMSVSSYGRTDNSATGSYGSKYVDVLVGGAYHEADPYRDGDGNRFTSVYPDFFSEGHLQSMALNSNPTLKSLVNMAPQDFPHVYKGTAPSPNRFRYSDRENNSTTMRTGWGRFAVKPTEDQKIEVAFTRQEADNIMYPTLFMDGNYDNITRGSVTYTAKDINRSWKEFKLQAYTNFVDHYMTDEMRCSSSGNPLCVSQKERPYSMATEAKTRTSGGKVESTFRLLQGETTFGIDHYTRNWDAQTTNRSLHMTSPQAKAMMTSGTSMTPAMMQNLPYRTQASIPDVTTHNTGAYLEQKNDLSKSLQMTAGLRYDSSNVAAGVDRRQLYNVYYPEIDTPYLYSYVTETALATNFDRELYGPYSPPKSHFENGSGYLKFDLELDRSHTVFAGYGYSVRTPDPRELYFAMQRMGTRMGPDYVGNPNLKNTKNSQGDIGYKYFDGSVMFQFNAFYSYLYDYIVPAEVSKNTRNYTPMDYAELAAYNAITGTPASTNNRYARSYRNINAVMYGGEISGMVVLPENLFAGVGAGYTRGINDSDDRNLPEMPPLKGYVRLRYDDNKNMAELEGEFAATQTLVDERLGETKTPGWGIANIKAGTKYGGMQFLFGVRNLFDRTYSEHLSYSRGIYSSGVQIPEPGRTVTVNMMWKF